MCIALIAQIQQEIRPRQLDLRNPNVDGNLRAMTTGNMPEFANVTAVAKANVYFDGKVVSHTIKFADGTKKTLGLIYAGEYHFGTDAPERMDIIAGSCEVKLDGSEEWKTFTGGSFFQVPGKSGFSIAVAGGIAEYVCSYE